MGRHRINARFLPKLTSRPKLSEIASGLRFGVSREAIRLVRYCLGITGRGRNRAKATEEQSSFESEKCNRKHVGEGSPRLREIKRRVVESGVAIEILMRELSGQAISLADRVCYLSNAGACTRTNIPLSRVIIRRPINDHKFDAAIFKLRRWSVVHPPDQLPEVATAFVLRRNKKNLGKKRRRRDWASYHYSGWNWLSESRHAQSDLQ